MTDDVQAVILARLYALEHAFIGLLIDLAVRQDKPYETVQATIAAIQARALEEARDDRDRVGFRLLEEQVIALLDRVAVAVKKQLGN